MSVEARVDEVRDEALAASRPGRAGSLRLWTGLGAVVMLLLVAVVAFAVGRFAAPAAEAAPATDSAAAGFARDMQVHHAQAVEMSMLVRERTADEEVRILAYDIALTQQQQIGQMFAWLVAWGLPQTTAQEPMAWMGEHGSGGDHMSMMGMASAADMALLGSLEGREAEVLFLDLMIEHHVGGVAMAEAVLEADAPDHVHRLAESMVVAQESEIAAMTDMRAARGVG